MSLNLQPGQTWRNRCGAFVTVEYKASQRTWYVRHESDASITGYLVNADGTPTMRARGDLALWERAERVYVSGANAGAAREHYRKRGCWVTGTDPDDLKGSLRDLIGCETLVLLPGYVTHQFSRAELCIADVLEMTIIYPQDY